MKFKLSVLGTSYTIFTDVPRSKDKWLADADGYCDPNAHKIVIVSKQENYSDEEWISYEKYCLRHEIVHAFMFESGIDGNCKFDIPDQTHPEFLVAWIANQFPKIFEAFKKVNAM